MGFEWARMLGGIGLFLLGMRLTRFLDSLTTPEAEAPGVDTGDAGDDRSGAPPGPAQ